MDLDEIEQQRQRLEAQVTSLRDSLKHWQLWDAEYEGFKEELQAKSDGNFTAPFLSELSVSYHGSLVDEKEIRDLSGLSSSQPRSRQQIINLVDRRLEYVSKNIETLSRQYYVAEGKLEEFDFAHAVAIGSDPRFADENAQADSPLVEIHEELDDHDNIVTSELRQPDLETKTILDAITSKYRSDNTAITSGSPSEPATSKPSTSEAPQYATDHHEQPWEDAEARRPPIRKKSVSFSADTKAAQQREPSEAPDGRKSVSFAAKVAVAPAAAPPDNRSVSFANAVEEIPANTVDTVTPDKKSNEPDSDLQSQLRSSFKPGDTVYELNDEELPARRHIVLPENESREDADMRLEMLNYHLNEVGNVVAAMDLDDGDGYGDEHSDLTGSEYLDDLDTPYTTGTSDEEDDDEFGRSKGSGISDQYRMQMSALSARLMHDGEKSPTSEAELAATQPTDTQTLAIRSGASSLSSVSSAPVEPKERSNSKKRVSFAEALDVATDDNHPSKLHKTIVHSPHPDKLVNTFDHEDASVGSAQDATSDDGADQPSGPIIADTLVERPVKQTAAVAPTNEDSELLMSRRELATEYYRRRNDMLREQGAFKGDRSDVGEDEQLYEERDGKVKKVSRFKAARLNG